MEKQVFDNQLRRQCISIPGMCAAQSDGIRKGLSDSIPAEVLKHIRRVVLTGCGDSYLAGIAAVPAFRHYASQFASSFEAVRCIDAARYLEYEESQADSTLVIGISASGTPARVVEALRRANHSGCHTLALTNGLDSPCANEAKYRLIVHTPAFPEPGPGLRNYYASILGLFALAAAMGEAKRTCPPDSLDQLLLQAETFTKEYEACMERIDNQMFDLAERWQNHRAVETVGDGPSFATAYFVGAKYVEAAGLMAATTDSENWCHVNYFKHEPENLGLIVIANQNERNHSRIVETLLQATGINRPVLLVADSEKEGFGAPEKTFVCTVPPAPKGYGFLTPLLNYIPGTLLAAYVAALRQEPYFRAQDSPQKRSTVGCTIRESQICV